MKKITTLLLCSILCNLNCICQDLSFHSIASHSNSKSLQSESVLQKPKMTKLISTQPDTFKFIIAEQLKLSTYNTIQIRKMSNKQFKSILYSANDPQIKKYLHTVNAKRALSTVFILTGVAIMGAGLLNQAENMQGSTTPVQQAEESNSGSNIILGGAAVVLVGSLISIGNKSLIRKAMIRYNNCTTQKTNLSLNVNPIQGSTFYGFTLSRQF